MSKAISNPLLIYKSRFKRSASETFEEATDNGKYDYWLTQEDIADIARIEYKNFDLMNPWRSEFEILGSPTHLAYQIQQFKQKTQHQKNSYQLTLIINVGNQHWVSLVIFDNSQSCNAYYIDSLGKRLANEYSDTLQAYQISVIDLSFFSIQQTDGSHCGLWALENAYDLNIMLNEYGTQGVGWIINQLGRPRNRDYFIYKRRALSEKLRSDETRRERIFQAKSQSIRDESTAKRIKLAEKDEISKLSETFVEAFINACVTRVAAAQIIAKDSGLTESTLIKELKTTTIAAVFGVAIARAAAGAIPASVAFIRSASNQFYLPKSKAQLITRAFSNEPSNLSLVLAEAALDIFQSFEAQFSQVTDRAGSKIAMEKLAEDAAVRTMNYIIKNWQNEEITSELISSGILLGQSEKYFSPEVKKIRLRLTGHSIQDMYGNKINTANLYEKIGLIVKLENHINKLYKSTTERATTHYGYRRLLSWEKNINGDLTEIYQKNYCQDIPQEETVYQHYSRNYEYQLQPATIQGRVAEIINKLNHKYPDPPKKVPIKRSILFELRSSIKNFTGRIAILKQLHKILISGRTTAIVAGLANLAVNADTAKDLPSSGSQVSVSGLGGIGKTQLALRYAELYAAEYDHNIIWINAETKADLERSFRRLAIKLDIDLKDKYSVDRSLESIVEDIYDYFSDRKSLFILDNVEEAKEIEVVLPKTMLGNKPNLLITSRYTNWRNIAQVLDLEVFTEAEASELIKKELNLIDESKDRQIKELIKLVQGLPLALQQAVAYIKNQNLIRPFEISHYIELFKTKNEELRILGFDFSKYSNDPYTKTVYTTWEITLEKIRQAPGGTEAIMLLEVMAYMYPDSINLNIFLRDRYYDTTLVVIVPLLESYAMIIKSNRPMYCAVHRLVQKVVAIKLAHDEAKFISVINFAESLLYEHNINLEIRKHYLYFILRTMEHKNVQSQLRYPTRAKKIFELFKTSNIDLVEFFDIARHEFSTSTYIEFLGKALFYYAKEGEPNFVSNLLIYIEKLRIDNILSTTHIESIFDMQFLEKHSEYKVKRFSSLSDRFAGQRIAYAQIYDYKIKKLKNDFFKPGCNTGDRKKRSISCLKEQRTARQFQYRHLQKVERIARFTTTGIFTRDTLSALVKGDLVNVAINFGFISGSVLLGKFSNELVAAGELLSTQEGRLIQKELLLAGQPALNILLHEELLSIEKQKFLGNSLKLASPFVARGIALVFVYDLLEKIKEYQNGNHVLLPGIVSMGVIVGVDGVGAGIEAAEILGLISGASAITGPVGEAITAMVWLGAEVYDIENQLAEIEKHVRLTTTEKFIQGSRAFFHLPPSDYVQEKAINNQQVAKAIAFLKEQSAIKRYAFSTNANDSSLLRSVYLNKKINILNIADNMPDEPDEGQLICLATDRLAPAQHMTLLVFNSILLIPTQDFSKQYNKTDIFRCENSLGVEYSLNRTGEATLIALGAGNDKVIVKSDTVTVMMLNKGYKNYEADNAIFKIQDQQVTGILQGGNGVNTLVLPEDLDTAYIDKQNIFCPRNSSIQLKQQDLCPCDGLKLKNIQIIYGRNNKQDILFLNKNVSFVDSGGGTEEDFDVIYVSDQCSEQLRLILRSHSIIIFLADAPVKLVDYSIPANAVGVSYVQFPFSAENQRHNFLFNRDISALHAINVATNFIKFTLRQSGQSDPFIVVIGDQDFLAQANETQQVKSPQNAYYLLQDGTEIKILPGGELYAKQRCTKSLETILNEYPIIASRLNMSFAIEHTNTQNETELILIGHNKHEILYSDPRFKNHLLGNNGDNIYVVLATNDSTIYPIPDITLYERDADEEDEESIDTLDLRQVIKAVEQQHPCFCNITEHGKHLLITMNRANESIVNISLSNALDTHWYETLNVLLYDQQPMHIHQTADTTWQLIARPLIFAEKEIIVLTEIDIKGSPEIIILKELGQYTLQIYNATDLLLTNAWSNISIPFNFCSILFKGFYSDESMKRSVMRSRLTFLDQALKMQDVAAQLTNATEFVFAAQDSLAANDTGFIRSRMARSITHDVQQSTITETGGWWLGGSALIAGITGIALYLRSLLRRPAEMLEEQRPLRQGIQATLAMLSMPFLQVEGLKTTLPTPVPNWFNHKKKHLFFKASANEGSSINAAIDLGINNVNRMTEISYQKKYASDFSMWPSTNVKAYENGLFIQWLGGLCNDSFAKRVTKARRMNFYKEQSKLDVIEQINEEINRMKSLFKN